MQPLPREVKPAHLILNPSREELRKLASHHERTTIYGSASYVTKVRNRSAKLTYIVPREVELGVKQAPIDPDRALAIAQEVQRYLAGREVVALDRTMGQHPDCRFSCRLYITREYARIAYMWHDTLFPPLAAPELLASPDFQPDMVSIYVPEWPERIIFLDPEAAVTYILGTDYFGECKKSFLRMAMYLAKKKGWLGFHAGSKVLRVKLNGELREVGFIMFGLSGTGKTTLTVHDHGLEPPEGVIIRQDDVVIMNERGYCYGTEAGFFFKTEGLEPSQKVLYQGATLPTAILENVMVYEDGTVDFQNYELTSNGRGVVARSDVANTDGEIDLLRADKILFITRRKDVVPPVAKLSPEQAAAFFMLGESIETSAGDPTKAGQSKREVGTNPFIVGPEAYEGNRLLEILRANPDIECFLFNTGSVGAGGSAGPEGEKITIKMSTSLMKLIASGKLRWRKDPDWGYLVPDVGEMDGTAASAGAELDGLDPRLFDPSSYYTPEEYRRRVESLREERRNWLAQFPGLDPDIVGAIEAPKAEGQASADHACAAAG